MSRTRIVLWMLLLNCAFTAAAQAEAKWIWSPRNKDDASGVPTFFRRTFEIAEPNTAKGSSRIEITADNTYILFVNGKRVGAGNNWQEGTVYDVSALLVKGNNTIAVECASPDKDAAMAARVIVKTKDGKAHEFSTDKNWKTTLTPALKWEQAKFDDAKWEPAHEFGEFGKTAPWNAVARFSDKPATGTWDPAATKAVNIEGTFIPQKPHGPWQFELKDGDRVVFLGATFVEREQQHGYLELALTARWPDRHITFRNLGWSGDTVFGEARARFGDQREGFSHLTRFLRGAQPTVVMIAYGFNESFDGTAGLERFKKGLDTLLKEVEITGARVALISPHKHENLGAPLPDATKNNDNLYLYTDALKAVANERGYPFFNLYDLPRCQRSVPFRAGDDDDRGTGNQRVTPHITDNGMHLTDLGYWHVAHQLPYLKPANWGVEINSRGEVAVAVGTQVSEVRSEGGMTRFTATDPVLTLPPVSVKTSNKSATKTPDGDRLWFSTRWLVLNGLAKGMYQLKIDGKVYSTFSAVDEQTHLQLTRTPELEQAESLRQAIIKKNELFFHSWRPQNETYIYLFRKHEQGNNAVEMPQFIPLVEAEEKKIAELRKPKAHVYEIVPAKAEK